MTLSLSNDSKNSISITNETRPNPTWDEATFTWDQAEGTWDDPGIVLTRETKNSISVSNETKN